MPALAHAQLAKVDEWLRSVLWYHQLPGEEHLVEVHRSKGRLVFEDESVKMIQGVREVFEVLDSQDQAGDTNGKIILIGRHLQGVDFEGSLLRLLHS